MRKILLKLDIGKINKNKIETREFTNKEGETVIKREYPVEVILQDETKVVKEGDGWNLIKSGFAVEGATKEERDNKTKTPILSDALEFESKEDVSQAEQEYNDTPF